MSYDLILSVDCVSFAKAKGGRKMYKTISLEIHALMSVDMPDDAYFFFTFAAIETWNRSKRHVWRRVILYWQQQCPNEKLLMIRKCRPYKLSSIHSLFLPHYTLLSVISVQNVVFHSLTCSLCVRRLIFFLCNWKHLFERARRCDGEWNQW